MVEQFVQLFLTKKLIIMKTILVITILLLIGFILGNCTKSDNPLPNPKTEAAATKTMLTQAEKVKRGEYLVTTSACDDCHTPKIMTDKGPVLDDSRRLSGYREGSKMAPITDKNILKDYALCNMELTGWVGPWGTSFAANLTPDETGTGNWTFAQFRKAIREGKYKGLDGSRQLLPPMPWEVYRNFTDQDLECIFAFLQSLQPIENLVPPPVPPNS